MITQKEHRRSLLFTFSSIILMASLAFASVAEAASVSHWAMDEGGGNTAYDSVSNNNASLLKGAKWTSGQFEGAVKFDGRNDHLKVSADASLNNLDSLDLELWIKPESLGERGQGWIISKARNGGALPNKGWALRLNNSPKNSLAFAVHYSGTRLEVKTVENSIELNEWNKVRVTWDGSEEAVGVKIYVNDEEVSYSKRKNGVGNRVSDANYSMFIGADPRKKRSFKGVIDEVKLNSLSVDEPAPEPEPEPEPEPTPEPTPEPEPEPTPEPTPEPDPTPEPSGWWVPATSSTWQYSLGGNVDTNKDVDVSFIDLFYNDKSVFDELHANGKKVACYVSVGSYEKDRPDSDLFPESVLGNVYDGWPDERWLDIRQLDVLGPIMEARLDLAVEKGCDGIDPDNIHGYENDTGFPLTAADQIAFNTWLANEAHERGLGIGLKNDIGQTSDLVDLYDWTLNEMCHQFNECDTLQPFTDAEKAVFVIEYNQDTADFCPSANANGYMAMNNNGWLLGGEHEVCWAQ